MTPGSVAKSSRRSARPTTRRSSAFRMRMRRRAGSVSERSFYGVWASAGLEIRWLPRAVRSRDDQLDYVAEHNPQAAIDLGDRIKERSPGPIGASAAGTRRPATAHARAGRHRHSLPRRYRIEASTVVILRVSMVHNNGRHRGDRAARWQDLAHRMTEWACKRPQQLSPTTAGSVPRSTTSSTRRASARSSRRCTGCIKLPDYP